MATRVPFTLLSLAITFLGVALSPVMALAHPPWDPYDDTRFAPVDKFGPTIGIDVLTSGLVAPLKAVAAPGHPGYLFVVDQPGKLWLVRLSDGRKWVFLDVRSRIVTLGVCGPNTFDERGLLGVAFHPRFRQNGLFYTYTSERRDRTDGVTPIPTPGTTAADADHQNVVAEWRANNPGNPTALANPGSRRELLRVNWPQFNHDGGDLGFGPDGLLYISMGDGGGADDADGQNFITAPPHNPPCPNEIPIDGHQGNGNGQRLNTPLGKIHRIDVDTRPFSPGKQYKVPPSNPFVGVSGAVPEIFAYGFRNPYRFSFDSRTGDLYVGDVGQNDLEEVSVVRKGGNFGWNCKEGTLFFHINGNDEGFASPQPDGSRTDCRGRHFIGPVAQYDTHHEGHSVIGGFVYRGRGIPKLYGNYIFGDFALLFKFPSGPHDYGRLFTFRPGGHGLAKISELLVLPGGAVSLAVLGIGQDAHGEIYVLGNVSGVPFPNPDATIGPTGRVLRLTPPPGDPGPDNDDDDD